ncbi:MAG: SGNH/GDSL hydrolase family protein [Patescibacteria group bacterium]|nr:SGNH/GDSL hydrolase family protein [Patescibacteria group bacterium]
MEKYNEVAKEHCQKQNINFINMFDTLDDSDLPDGLHPNEVGYEKMYGRIKDFLVDKNLIKKI